MISKKACRLTEIRTGFLIKPFSVDLHDVSVPVPSYKATTKYQLRASGRFPKFSTISFQYESHRFCISCFSDSVIPVPFALRNVRCRACNNFRSSLKCANWRMTYAAQKRQDHIPIGPGFKVTAFWGTRGEEMVVGMMSRDVR